MIAILKQSASDEAVSHIVSWIEKKGLKTDVSRGENETIIGLVGDTTKIDPFLLESMDVVERVQRVSEPFKRANRKFHPEDSVIDCGHGVEDRRRSVASHRRPVLRRGPEPHPHRPPREGRRRHDAARRCLQAPHLPVRLPGHGPRRSGPAVRGICRARHADRHRDHGPARRAGLLGQKDRRHAVGARNAQNFPLLKEVGKTKTPILLKRGMSGTIDELLMAAEYIMSEGNDNVILCERGIRTFETRTRNTFDLNAVPVLHHLSHLPVVADPSHATGYTRYVEPMALAATACGANGLEIEVHDEPSRAWSDGAQPRPNKFDDTMRRIRAIREVVCQETME